MGPRRDLWLGGGAAVSLADPRSRKARTAEAKALLDEQGALRQAEHEQRLAAKAFAEKTRTTRGGGRPFKPRRPKPEPKVNLTDPTRRVMRDWKGYLQGYNAQAGDLGRSLSRCSKPRSYECI
jgi:hypothetical protein